MLARILQTFKDTLFPNKCLACGRFFHPATNSRIEKIQTQEMIHSPMEHLFRRVMVSFPSGMHRRFYSGDLSLLHAMRSNIRKPFRE